MVSHDPHLKLAVRIVVCDGIVALQGQGMESNEVLSGRCGRLPPPNGAFPPGMKSGKKMCVFVAFRNMLDAKCNPGVLSENQTHIENVVGRCAG